MNGPWFPEAYSGHYHISKMERHAKKTKKRLKPLTIFAKRSVLDVLEGSE